ncbi:DNA (cytosine-5-)-methyltransferase [Bacteroides sp. AF16-49]|uniref:DNA cytosine methyltransferase n=1 Tax=Bacteroides sp. AF16-49 TaxID=2292192 RepID=UPI000EFED3E1|nr:DNA (cytosine-5-)-methyltransferase [Bacteroides sp. AF16-49]RHR75555.1 DNA (cytosine-5-)-methyltransferase [Bacteroides sp. AF16-49]
MNNTLFPYKWYLQNGYPERNIKRHNLKVFGTFICGGGSSMGYKLAGYQHLGGVELDASIAEVYKKNHNPKYIFVEDIRAFNKRNDLPDELYHLDILDGSPPCSTFSMCGQREKAWGKQKHFKEGQVLQRLDDLVFVYIDTIKKLKPKVAILENVKGIILGNAMAYAKEILKSLNIIGYDVQVFLLNAASMGIPQKRERVFFICRRKDMELPKLNLKFNAPPVLFNQIIDRRDEVVTLTEYQKMLWDKRCKTDKSFGDIIDRTEHRLSMFSNPIIHSDDVAPTLTSGAGVNALYDLPRSLNKKELCEIGSYPVDYDFGNVKPEYLIGMSVPPAMIANIAYQIAMQCFNI